MSTAAPSALSPNVRVRLAHSGVKGVVVEIRKGIVTVALDLGGTLRCTEDQLVKAGK